jgi:nucleoside-diphosphate-sugar epimerase
VIHCAFDHSAFGGNDFSKFLEVCEKDRRAIDALGDALRGSDRPLVITSGTGMGNAAPGQPANEDHFDPDHPNPRRLSEVAGAAVSERGVNVSVVRLPQVHDTVKQGLITYAVQVAREKGASAYIGEGLNRWPAAHVLDVARLYRHALEKRDAGSRYNAVAEEGVSMREIAEVIGRGLKVPVVSLSQQEAQAHFGWLAMFVSYYMPASSAQTRRRLGWRPTGPGLIADLEQMLWPEAVTH